MTYKRLEVQYCYWPRHPGCKNRDSLIRSPQELFRFNTENSVPRQDDRTRFLVRTSENDNDQNNVPVELDFFIVAEGSLTVDESPISRSLNIIKGSSSWFCVSDNSFLATGAEDKSVPDGWLENGVPATGAGPVVLSDSLEA